MLSILIPTYNYYIYDLVLNLHEKCINAAINFEIICLDDASRHEFTEKNKSIEQLSFCSYTINQNNKGRTATRQQLANQAKYDWLLFLDADVMPKNNEFIDLYLTFLSQNYSAIFGGFAYKNEKNNQKLLRWKYGKKNEQVSAKKRNLKPYKVIISANFMVKKTTYINLSNSINISTYGADLVLASLLKEQQVKVFHIDNEVFHLGLEDNNTFLNKQKEAIKLLYNLYKNQTIKAHDNTLLNTYNSIKKLNLQKVFSWIYIKYASSFEANLLGKNPNVSALQLYKLSYFCYLAR